MLGYLPLSEVELLFLIDAIQPGYHWPPPQYQEDANTIPLDDDKRRAGGPEFRLHLTSLRALGMERDEYPVPFFPTLAELNLLDMFLVLGKSLSDAKLPDGTPLLHFMGRIWAEQRRLNAALVPEYVRQGLGLVVLQNDDLDDKYTDKLGLAFYDNMLRRMEDHDIAS
jgi:hypothetical protein